MFKGVLRTLVSFLSFYLTLILLSHDVNAAPAGSAEKNSVVHQSGQTTLDVEAAYRASQENIDKLLQKIELLKNKDLQKSALIGSQNEFFQFQQNLKLNSNFDHNCDPDSGSGQRCVRNCKSRWSDGSCSSYDKDFCGPHAACATQCKSRWSDGSCSSYDKDFCGPYASCSENCKSRWSDGSCSSYGPDICS